VKANEQHPSGSQELGRINTLTWDSWSSPFGRGELAPAQLNSGDLVVLRGGSGLGKTTFLHSLLRFNSSATIHINSAPIEGFSRESVHKAIGWAPQNPSLISGSIRDLFTLVDPSLTDNDLIAVLDQVGLQLTELPNGLDTVVSGVGEKSGHISGGQRRRISIARALATNPSLLIADEPTADLDPASAQEILSLLATVARNGVIVIAVLHAPDQMIDGAQEIVMVER
jgi:ABC-type transport system involved in cytochrome bd biosynthesis fused ATPase/permease subunit